MNRMLLKESLLRNVEYQFSLSGGSGGQNVNKVNTKVHASIMLDKIEGLTAEELNAVKIKLISRINNEKRLYVAVMEERTQERNREIALIRLENLIAQSAKIQKKRHATRPSKTAVEKRLALKKRLSLKKRDRNPSPEY